MSKLLLFLWLLPCMGYHAIAGTDVVIQKVSVISYEKLHDIAQSITPAIQIAYRHDGQVEHDNYGYKDIQTKEPIDGQTIFQAASLSKIVATYAFLILVDKGILDLDKPLWEYVEYDRLKEDRYRKKITARHVLTHQSGLVNWESSAGSKA